MVQRHLKGIPVLSDGVVTGVLARRDLLRLLVRTDADVHDDVAAILDHVGEEPFSVDVADGIVTINRWLGPASRRRIEGSREDGPRRDGGGVQRVAREGVSSALATRAHVRPKTGEMKRELGLGMATRWAGSARSRVGPTRTRAGPSVTSSGPDGSGYWIAAWVGNAAVTVAFVGYLSERRSPR